jgi:beta-lactamase class A
MTLIEEIEEIIKPYDAKIGFYSLRFKDNLNHSINGNEIFPMQSVYKFHLALAVFNDIDKGRLSLEQDILILENDLIPNIWSPIRDRFPEANIKLKLKELLYFMISDSDNIACDILFRLVGGVNTVNKFISGIGIKSVSIVNTEEEIQADWDLQFQNFTTPQSAVELLRLFFEKKILSPKSSDFLLKLMRETKTGLKRIRGLLPENAIVAHKTGYSGKNEVGIIAACNDIGIVALPNQLNFGIAVFVSNSIHDLDENELIIARITKIIWDHYLQ